MTELKIGDFVRAVYFNRTIEGVCIVVHPEQDRVRVLDVQVRDETFNCVIEGAVKFDDKELRGRGILGWVQQIRKNIAETGSWWQSR